MVRRHSIKFKLTAAFLSIMIVVLLFQFFYLGPRFVKGEIDNAKNNLVFINSNITSGFQFRFVQAVDELERMADIPGLDTMNRETLDGMISIFNESNVFFNYFFVMDRTGRWISFPTIPENVGTRIPENNMYWVEQTFSGGSTVFLDVLRSVTCTLVSGFSTPIGPDKQNARTLLRGVFVVSEENSLVNLIRGIRVGSGGYAYLVASNGWLLVHPGRELLYEDYDAYSMMEYEPVRMALAGENGITEYEYEGETWLAAYGTIPLTGWAVIVQQPKEGILRKAQSESGIINLLVFGIFVFIFIAVLVIINRSLKPLSNLVNQIKTRSRPFASTYAKDEIGELAREFDHLYADLYRSNEKITKSEFRFRLLFNNAKDAIFFHDMSGNILEVNQVACNRLGYTREELIGENVAKIDAPSSRVLIEKRLNIMKEKGFILFEAEHMTKDGKIIPVEINSSVIDLEEGKATLSIVRDLTERKEAEKERKKLEQQIIQAQKLEALGTLAGGFAHDFNNLLMGIQVNATLLHANLSGDRENLVRVNDIGELVHRGISLTRQLLGLGRGGKYEVEVVDVNDLLNKSATLFGRSRKEIRIHFSFDSELMAVEADRGQLEQVFLNLYVNAWQAMPDGGDLYIGTENVKLEISDENGFSLPSGMYVKISITDTGEGIDESIRQKVFDPFFTTKEGTGSGLGLASSYGIVRNHNGNITIYSEKGKGSTFNIYLPATGKHPEPVMSEEDRKIPGGKETILLVDDEETIIRSGKAFFKTLGYTVLAASSGHDALAIYRQKKESIDIVILDLIMPGMGGRETFAELKKIDPAVKVLLSSGYSINGQAQELLNKGCLGFLQKPFSLLQAAKKIRSILDG
ncbi:MAG: PAS domain S-box protein [Spirochaetales bacterium]|nr:PAS domain S-box protein [Spirochaetales bacterium]